MKNLKPKCGVTNAQFNVLIDSIDALQSDLALLQTKVDGFNTSFESVNGKFDSLITEDFVSTGESNLTTANIDSLGIKSSHRVFYPVSENVAEKCLFKTRDFSHLWITVMVDGDDAKKSNIEIEQVNNVFIIKSDSETTEKAVSTLKIYKKGDYYFFTVDNPHGALLNFWLSGDGEDFDYTQPLPADATLFRTIDVSSPVITLSGDLVYNGQTTATFDNVEITNAKVRDLVKLGNNTYLRVNAVSFNAKQFNKVSSPGSVVSLDNGNVVLAFDEDGELLHAVVRDNSEIHRSFTTGSVYYKNADYAVEHEKHISWVLNHNENPNTAINTDILEPDENTVMICNGPSEWTNKFTAEDVTLGKVKINGPLNGYRAEFDTLNTDYITADRGNISKLGSETVTTTNTETRTLTLTNSCFIEPNPSTTDFHYITLKFDGGKAFVKIEKDGKSLATLTIDREKINSRSTLVNYAIKEPEDLLEIVEDKDGVYLKTKASSCVVKYGIVGVDSKNNTLSVESVNTTPFDTAHANVFPVSKRAHALILGDGTSDFGIDVKGEVHADLIPEPGTQSTEDLAVSNTLSVGGKSTLADVESSGNVTVDGKTTTNELDAATGTITTLGSTDFTSATGNITTLESTDITATNIEATTSLKKAGKEVSTASNLLNSVENGIKLKGSPSETPDDVKGKYSKDFSFSIGSFPPETAGVQNGLILPQTKLLKVVWGGDRLEAGMRIEELQNPSNASTIESIEINDAGEKILHLTSNFDCSSSGGTGPTKTIKEVRNEFDLGKGSKGDFSASFGKDTTATGPASTTFGTNTMASGKGATAFGSWTTATGSNSTAFGLSSLASAASSTAFGSNTKAKGDNSVAFGNDTTADRENSAAFGVGTSTPGENSAVFGSYNSSKAGDIFEIGNGTAEGGNSNALEVSTTGQVRVGKVNLTNENNIFEIGTKADGAGETNLSLNKKGDLTIEGSLFEGVPTLQLPVNTVLTLDATSADEARESLPPYGTWLSC